MDSGNNREKKEEKRMEKSEKSVTATKPIVSSPITTSSTTTTTIARKTPTTPLPTLSVSKSTSPAVFLPRVAQIAKKNNKPPSLTTSPSTTTTTSTSTSTTTSTPTHTPLAIDESKISRAPSKPRPTYSHSHSHTHSSTQSLPHSHRSSVARYSEVFKPETKTEVSKTEGIKTEVSKTEGTRTEVSKVTIEPSISSKTVSSEQSATSKTAARKSYPSIQYKSVTATRTPTYDHTETTSSSFKPVSSIARIPSVSMPIAEEQKDVPPLYKSKAHSTHKATSSHTACTKQPEKRESSSTSLTNNNNNTPASVSSMARASAAAPRFVEVRSASESSSSEEYYDEDDDTDDDDDDENINLEGGLRDLSDADIAFLLQGIEAQKALRRLQRQQHEFASLMHMGIEQRRPPAYRNNNVSFIPQERQDFSYESLVQLEDVVCGVPKDIIDSLPKSIFQKQTSNQGEDFTPFSGASSECSICLTEWEEGDVIMTLPCVHNFHFECGEKWLNVKKTCPNCKDEVCP
eukprot:TRINITY_DN7945_c0_g1_i1.p1 TRINITY_DN7945_c0_g1~~TRINITY_DN7945_c0_g1_i1.p1  ORF type:complete len:517 (-),score=135.79 TRINITY_DN7945_c0_g1_i1:182-1732(-)